MVLLGSFTPWESKKFKVKTVVIDAGHGGKDPGCHGKVSKESEVALKVALELGKTIKTYMPDVKVVYTRTTDKFVELHDRAEIANKNNADLFISIHCNSADNKQVHGTETYTMGLGKSDGNLDVAKRENSVILQEEDYLKKYDGFNPNSPMAHIYFANLQSAYLENSLRFADHVETQFKSRVGRNSRGVKQGNLLVLWKSSMPSALIEIGFLTNAQEEKFLNDPLGQSYIASAIYRAFRDYRENIEVNN